VQEWINRNSMEAMTMLYREDIDEVRKRLTVWWQGGDIGRPALLLSAPRTRPLEHVPELPQPEDVTCPRYTTKDFDFRVNWNTRACVGTEYLAEAVPTASPCLGPDCLALYLGCESRENGDNVWYEPCIEAPESARFEYRADNVYWDFQLRLIRALKAAGKDRFMIAFPDFIEGLDTLAAMRGTEPLLFDLIERPDWVHASLKEITALYWRYYDAVYDLIRDETGGSHFWVWAPGQCAKFQCDCSAMFSPDMFREFMVPVLEEMCNRIPYSIYHWDGPGALGHHEHLLSIQSLKVLQWTAGAGAEPQQHPRWWPLYHRTIDAGKKVFIGADLDGLKAMKREFGPKLKQFLITAGLRNAADAAEFIRTAEVD
jgi:hypothetical protein